MSDQQLEFLEELVDVAKPGDRIEITGIYRASPIRTNPRRRTCRSIYKTCARGPPPTRAPPHAPPRARARTLKPPAALRPRGEGSSARGGLGLSGVRSPCPR